MSDDRHRDPTKRTDAQARLRIALEAAFIFTFDWDIQNDVVRRQVDATCAFPEMPEHECERFDDVVAHVHPDDREQFKARVMGALEERLETYESSYRALAADGSSVYIEERGRFEYGDDGTPIRLTGVAQDVTRRRRADDAAKSSARQLEFAASVAGVGTFEYDFEERTAMLSAALSMAAGFGDHVGPRPLSEIASRLHPDDRDRVMSKLRACVVDDTDFDDEHRFVLDDGTARWFHARGRTSEDGQRSKVIGVSVDVTARNDREQQRRDDQRRLQLALEAAELGTFAYSLSENVIRLDPRAQQICGLDGEVVTPNELKKLVDRDELEHLKNVARRARAGAEVSDVQFRLQRSDGAQRWCAVHYAIDGSPDAPTRVIGTVSDVTGQFQIRRALEDSENRFRALADSSPVILWVNGMQGVMFVNRACRDFFGATEAKIQTYGWTNFIHPDDRERYVDAYMDALDAGTSFSADVRLRRHDGVYRWMHSQAVPRYDTEGHCIGFNGCTFDITEIREAEAKIRASEQRVRQIAEAMPQLVWTATDEGTVTYHNASDNRIAQTTANPDTPLDERNLAPEDRAEARVAWSKAVASGATYEHKHRLVMADDTTRWHLSRAIRADDGTWIGTSTDIHELVSTQAALRTSEERLKRAAEATGFGTYDHYIEAGYSVWSREVFDIVGLQPAPRVPTKMVIDLIRPDDRSAFEAVLREEAGTDSNDRHSIEFRIVRSDGEVRWLRDVGRRFPSDGDGPSRIIGTIQDITERRAAEEALREEDRRKDEFIAMLGHELRNPLAAIRMATDISQAHPTDVPALQRARDVLDRQTQHMARLVDGLLEVSRVARGKVEIERRTLDLSRLVSRVVDDRRSQFDDRKTTVHLTVSNVWVHGDAVRLRQVFDNIIDNALHFTEPEGAIRIDVHAADQIAEVVIEDDGAGIRREMLPLIFEPFQQEKQDIARRSGGLGLGLALARGLVELHGGSIVAESAGLGHGATFRIRLASTPPETGSSSVERPAPSRQRILVVEDNVDAAEMLEMVLEARGHEVHLANDGFAAVERLRANHFDLVLCDIGLPGIDGYTVAKEIRRDRHIARPKMLVALTGYGSEEDRLRTADAGFDRHMIKPIRARDVDDLLREVGE